MINVESLEYGLTNYTVWYKPSELHKPEQFENKS